MLSSRLKKVAAISALHDTEGGKLLVATLLKDIVGLVDTLAIRHRELTLQEFVAIGAEIKNKLDLVQVIAQSPANAAQAREELKELLKAIETEQ